MKRLIAFLFLLPACAWAGVVQPAQSPAVQTGDHFGSPCPYPEVARNALREGITYVSYRGTDDGRIEDVKIIRSSDNSYLDEATVKCVSHWRFDPNNAADKFNVGIHRTGIAWKIPNVPPGASSNPPAGVQIGLAHTCANYYPRAEAQAGIEGTTRMQFTITAAGEVRDASVEQSSGNSNLDAAALQCVHYWRYRPATMDGRPVDVPWKAMVAWKLEPPSVPPFAEPPRDCLHSYPVKAEDIKGIDGATDLTFKIVRGEVRDVTVTHSSGSSALDRNAVECVGSRRYQREMITAQDGTIVDRWQSMTLKESINWTDALKTGK